MSIILKMKISNLTVKILLQNLLKVGRKANDIWTHFGNFGKEEYLISLRERLPLMHKNCDLREPKEGEIVIIKEDDVPRSSWKLGKIMRLMPSRDYKIRSAEIQLPSKSIVKRAVNYLYSFELQGQVSKKSNKGLTRCCHNDDLTESDEQNLSLDGVRFTENGVTSKCGQRKASLEAQRAIYNCLKDNCYAIIFCPSRECQEDI